MINYDVVGTFNFRGEEEREEDVAEELVEEIEHWRMRAQLSLMSMGEFSCNKE